MATSKQNGADKGAFLDTVDEQSPSNADIFAYLKQMDTKIVNIESKLKTLDVLEQKVNSFDRELKKM